VSKNVCRFALKLARFFTSHCIPRKDSTMVYASFEILNLGKRTDEQNAERKQILYEEDADDDNS
jgi:hypothetical protein